MNSNYVLEYSKKSFDRNLEWKLNRLNDLLTILVSGDLLVKDCFGATAVDYIHNKHLNYCGMVIRAHSQCNEHQTTKNAFVSEPCNMER